MLHNLYCTYLVPFCSQVSSSRIPVMSEHNRSPSRSVPKQWFNLIYLFTFGLCSVKLRDFPCYDCEYCLRVPLIPAIDPGHIMPHSNCYLGMHSWDCTGQ